MPDYTYRHICQECHGQRKEISCSMSRQSYTVKNEEFGLLFGGVIMGSNTYGEFK